MPTSLGRVGAVVVLRSLSAVGPQVRGGHPAALRDVVVDDRAAAHGFLERSGLIFSSFRLVVVDGRNGNRGSADVGLGWAVCAYLYRSELWARGPGPARAMTWD
jgi:hypothetical protein